MRAARQREELLAVVQGTMQLAQVSLWLRPSQPASRHQTTGISWTLLDSHRQKKFADMSFISSTTIGREP